MNFRWLHISDLHFGFENFTISHMRSQFIEYIKGFMSIDYLFITGDLIYGPRYTNGLDENLLSFINQIQSTLSIRKQETFIVPGNHDIKRDEIRNLVISKILDSYDSQVGIIDKQFIAYLDQTKLNYNGLHRKITDSIIESNHFFIKTKNCNIIHLNTALLSGTNYEDGSLIIGMQLLRDSLDQLDTSLPSIVLAHHGFNCLSKSEQYQLESYLKDNNISLYLCGHNHYATSRIILSSRQDKELWECSCGTHMNGNMVDMSFFAGDYNDSNKTWIIEAHKWSPKFASWMLDSDFSFPQGGALDGKCYYPVKTRYEYSKQEQKTTITINESKKTTTVFISYSWDSESHKERVKDLAHKLCNDGINVIYDGNLELGERLFDFMEQSIVDSDYVLFICSPEYKKKADKKNGGVGYESTIISRELYHLHNERKFIPILFSGSWSDSIPRWAIGKVGVDFRNQENDEQEYSSLLKNLKRVNLVDNIDKNNKISDIVIPENDPAIGVNIVNKRFKIAFSFPGEHREQVKMIVDQLTKKILPDTILYDQFHTAEFARPNLDIYLQKLYYDESELIVVVISKEYEAKNWCGLEWRAIRDLLNKRQGNIMFLKSGKGAVPGFFDSLDGYIDIAEQGITETAELILEKYNFISKTDSLFRLSSRHLDPVEVQKIIRTLAPMLIPCKPGEADLRMKDENGNELYFSYSEN